MATPSDATFGAGFDATAFRAAIRNTMTMGLPNASADKATFVWTASRTYTSEDPSHNPYSWTATPVTETTHADVQVPVAVEFAPRPAASQDTSLGQFDATRVSLTLLDTDYDLVEGADKVTLGGNTYVIDFIGPPVGLFDVTIYTIYATAQDES